MKRYKNTRGIRYAFAAMLFASCGRTLDPAEKQAIWKKMRSGDKSKIIDAVEDIRESKDTSMLPALLYQVNDPRITHILWYKGMSIYQIKIYAIAELSGIDPPKKITDDVDTSEIVPI